MNKIMHFSSFKFNGSKHLFLEATNFHERLKGVSFLINHLFPLSAEQKELSKLLSDPLRVLYLTVPERNKAVKELEQSSSSSRHLLVTPINPITYFEVFTRLEAEFKANSFDVLVMGDYSAAGQDLGDFNRLIKRIQSLNWSYYPTQRKPIIQESSSRKINPNNPPELVFSLSQGVLTLVLANEIQRNDNYWVK